MGRQSTALGRLCFPCGRAMPPYGEGSNMLLPALPAKDDAGLGRE
jgi:hypothetical protein